ncbi:MAG: adenine deaminase, partial [Clostridia bacterium]|nr:adenine deaminase [Clostridia bacterium]
MKYPAGGLASRIDTALGLTPADVVLVGGEVVDVFTGEIIRADVAIKDGYIVGVGEYQEGREMVDVTSRYLLPGFIDAHIHIESSMLTPPAFARVVVPRGTTAIV